MQTIKLIEQEPNKFKVECDEDFIPLDVVEQTINQLAAMVADRTISKCTRDFTSTEDGKMLFNLVQELKHYKFWNKVLYILCLLLCAFILWKGLM